MHTLTLCGKVVKKDFVGVMKIGHIIGIIKFILITEATTKFDSQTSSSNESPRSFSLGGASFQNNVRYFLSSFTFVNAFQ
jgi:hypothetical protein